MYAFSHVSLALGLSGFILRNSNCFAEIREQLVKTAIINILCFDWAQHLQDKKTVSPEDSMI